MIALPGTIDPEHQFDTDLRHYKERVRDQVEQPSKRQPVTYRLCS
jgi:hypothetical protein